MRFTEKVATGSRVKLEDNFENAQTLVVGET